ncbi:uncharacterized protein GGS22DRAFT_167000 [Annulohypoxylon maeteangense]|uniref:uncharacterized protein n=1 Tax=Annulohypoxylon maeteangense TaxID=1927788 RepID=UPI0020074B61|nr:uncharacterized protein GGS22DRAFT_167000 [Annulohypoxylon maeteangense]KAI0883437.1 hypothetical protein GGS22DRAFT_167000 [Annulohypoxylon maeteangense]
MSTSKKLAIRQKPTGLPGPCRILDLPPELVFEILSFLDPPYVILFSLTCKATRRLISSTPHGKFCLSYVQKGLRDCRREPIGSESTSDPRYKFLQLLADDNLHRFVCLRCAKLHQNLTGESRNAHHNSAIIRDRLISRPRGAMTFGPLWPKYVITFDEAREILKGTLNKPRNKLPIPPLAISTDWKLARLWSSCYNPEFIHGYVKLDTEATVVDGSLYFHKVQRILLQPEKVKPFFSASKSWLMEELFKSCTHSGQFRYAFQPSLSSFSWNSLDKTGVHRMIAELIAMAHWKVLLAEPSRLEGWDLDKLELQSYSLTGCCQCVTDNSITIHSHGRGGVEIVADVFQNLGDLTKSSDRKWEACWHNRLDEVYRSILVRRSDHPIIDPSIFFTPPGRSARKHPSAPSVNDVWELHEHDREASRKYSKP